MRAWCPCALAGADLDAFAAAVSVVHSRTYGVGSSAGEGYFRALLPLADLLNHGGDEYPRVREAEAAGTAAATTAAAVEDVAAAGAAGTADLTGMGAVAGAVGAAARAVGSTEAAAREVAAADGLLNAAAVAASPAAVVKWPPAGCADNIAWSALDDDGVIEFAATRDMRAGDEALMSYGERSNDHFLMYYGFVPPRNPHDDVIVFSDVVG